MLAATSTGRFFNLRVQTSDPKSKSLSQSFRTTSRTKPFYKAREFAVNPYPVKTFTRPLKPPQNGPSGRNSLQIKTTSRMSSPYSKNRQSANPPGCPLYLTLSTASVYHGRPRDDGRIFGEKSSRHDLAARVLSTRFNTHFPLKLPHEFSRPVYRLADGRRSTSRDVAASRF